MADAKRERQRQARQSRIAAEQAARRRAARQRTAIIGGALFAVLAAVVLIFNRGDGDETVETGAPSTTAAASTTTEAGEMESAAGKPCVARSEPLPEGAPEVPVQEGPPPSELVVDDLTEGDGQTVPEGATVTIHYTGVSCSSGLVFDSSHPGEPATFPLTSLIPGWQQGIPGMKVGGARLLGIPPDLAYGDTARPPDIAAQETLWFVVELLGVGEEGSAGAPGA